MADWVGVVTTHPHRTLTCGVAKFSAQLAQHLGLPCWSVEQRQRGGVVGPVLLSIRPAECATTTMRWDRRQIHDLFLHGATTAHTPAWLMRDARRIYVASAALARRIADDRLDVQALWCPSLLRPGDPSCALRVLTFGMAHKLAESPRTIARWFHLRRLLDQTGEPYEIRISCAVHEGYLWEETWRATEQRMREVFDDHVVMLGFLSDTMLWRELREATAVALLYDPAVRENNTSLWAALDAGAAVITTLDADSPAELVHDQTVLDLDQLTSWPLVEEWRREAVQGREWSALVKELCDASAVEGRDPRHGLRMGGSPV